MCRYLNSLVNLLQDIQNLLRKINFDISVCVDHVNFFVM